MALVTFLHRHRGTLVITLTTLMHLFQALLLWWDPSSSGCIAIATMLIVFGTREILILSMLVCVAMAVLALFAHGVSPTKRLMMLIPQQALLTIVAMGAVRAVYLSHYADGYRASAAFILSDQLPVLVLLGAHTGAILRRAENLDVDSAIYVLSGAALVVAVLTLVSQAWGSRAGVQSSAIAALETEVRKWKGDHSVQARQLSRCERTRDDQEQTIFELRDKVRRYRAQMIKAGLRPEENGAHKGDSE